MQIRGRVLIKNNRVERRDSSNLLKNWGWRGWSPSTTAYFGATKTGLIRTYVEFVCLVWGFYGWAERWRAAFCVFLLKLFYLTSSSGSNCKEYFSLLTLSRPGRL